MDPPLGHSGHGFDYGVGERIPLRSVLEIAIRQLRIRPARILVAGPVRGGDVERQGGVSQGSVTVTANSTVFEALHEGARGVCVTVVPVSALVATDDPGAEADQGEPAGGGR